MPTRPIDPKPPPRPPLMTRDFAVLLASQAGFGYAFSSFFLLPKYLASELGVSAAAVGSVTTSTSAFTVVFMIAIGSLADLRGRRPFLIGGALLMAAASFGFVFVDEFGWTVYALRSLQALAFAMAYVAGAAMTVDHAPPQRLGEALGYFGLTGLAMNAVAPAIVEGLAASHGWEWSFATAGAGALLCALLGCLTRETGGHASESSPGPPMLALVRSGRNLAAGGVMTFVGCAFATLFVFHQLYALELGIERVRVFFVCYSVAALLTRLLLGGLGDRIGRRSVATGSLALYSLSVFAMIDVANLGLAAVGAAFGLAHGIFYPTYSAWLLEGVDERARARVVALLQAWFNVGIAASSFALGALADARGYPVVFAIAGAGVAIALVIVALTPRQTGARESGAVRDVTLTSPLDPVPE